MKPNRTRILPSMLMLTLVGLLLTLFSSFGLPLAHAFVNGQAANLVLGQPNFNSETQSTTDAGMNGPNGVAVDPTTGKFFVADANNNRILRFASAASLTNGAVAEGVFGQADFTSSSANRGFTTPDAKRLLDPSGVAVGSDGTPLGRRREQPPRAAFRQRGDSDARRQRRSRRCQRRPRPSQFCEWLDQSQQHGGREHAELSHWGGGG